MTSSTLQKSPRSSASKYDRWKMERKKKKEDNYAMNSYLREHFPYEHTCDNRSKQIFLEHNGVRVMFHMTKNKWMYKGKAYYGDLASLAKWLWEYDMRTRVTDSGAQT